MSITQFDFTEIQDGNQFEFLVYECVISMYKNTMNLIELDEIIPPAEGTDGGVDFHFTVRINDSLSEIKRKWLVQCKFNKRKLTPKQIGEINIPSLIHQHGAVGYLLVTNTGITTNVGRMFEDLNRNCTFRYKYKIWTGIDLRNIIGQDDNIIRNYFPKYYNQYK